MHTIVDTSCLQIRSPQGKDSSEIEERLKRDRAKNGNGEGVM